MIYNRTGLFIIIRVLILSVLIMGTAYSYFKTDFIMSPFMLALFSILSIIELIWHLQRMQRSWAQFLLSLEQRDFGRSYSHIRGFDELKRAYELITSSFENLNTDKQADYRLLQTISEHLQIGLICFKKDGQVVLVNQTFMTLLNLDSIVRIDKLQKDYADILHYLTDTEAETNEVIETIANQRLLIKKESFKLRNHDYRMASLYDIKSTLDTNEIESYQRLMRVMAHEIKNSATPILSLIKIVTKKLVKDEQLHTLDKKDQRNVAISLKAIETRTGGILKFVENYRKINTVIYPKLEKISTQSLIEPIHVLMMEHSKAKFTVIDNVSDQLMVDPHLLSQVLINLLKNAEEATSHLDNANIILALEKTKSSIEIRIEDNGTGVSMANEAQIFVPFYTTKEAGSGIGLALSVRIVKAHEGSLNYYRTENDMTRFTITLPNILEDS